jgi:hypothetical protein
MRQNIKEYEIYDKRITTLDLAFKQSKERRDNNEVPPERIKISIDKARTNKLFKTILHFTFGKPLNEVQNEFNNVIQYTNENWVGLWTLKLSADKILNQYILSAYDEMIWMLSLGYLLEVPNEDFKKLVEVIDRDGVKDYLFEFIIRAKLDDREPITEESYREYFGVPKVFEKLRQAITETDKAKAEKLVKEFITKDWYKNHKDAGWYNSHKSKHNTYFGYWSFETAAVVKIMGLDDSSFIDCQYYPKDLVHQEIK